MAKWTKRRAIVVLFFIAFWATIDYLAFDYQTAEWNRTFVWPDGWLHKVRTISYKGTDYNDTHGLNVEYISTVTGYPKLGAEDGVFPGLDSPWKGWTDWTSYSFQIGKDEEGLSDSTLMTWFAAFKVYCPPGMEGQYDIYIGNSESIKIWKDGELIFEKYIIEPQRIIPDTDKIEGVEFHTGPNIFLVETFKKLETTGFCFRIKKDNIVMPWLGFYYYMTLPSPNYGYQITAISIAVIAAFIWVYIYY
ncbi:MAG: hypothetical protein ACTSO9_08375 [Candidatus Helarchaeota archaeon]